MSEQDNSERETLQTIPFYLEDGTEVPMYILEETTLQGVRYLMVSDDYNTESEEATVIILKEGKSTGEEPDQEEYSIYEEIDDDRELQAVAKVFAELLEDVDLQMP